MAFDFDKAAGKAKSRAIAGAKGRARAQKSDEPQESDYVKRNRQEARRRKLATCNDYWASICFRTAAEVDDFKSITGFGDLTFGDEAEELLSRCMKRENRRSRVMPVRGYLRLSYPFDDIPYTHGLEADCEEEAAALLESIRGRENLEEYRAATDSPYHIELVCRDDDDRDRLYDIFDLWRFGAGYLDGSRWLVRLKSGAL